jgi:NAD(P)-dependent dehydrogenase (short-subunit alcohol dehydrogenase family)
VSAAITEPLPRIDLDLSDRVALVTGAGRGIGREAALRLAGHGAAVVALSRTGDELEQLAEEIVAGGAYCLPIVCDVTDPEQVEEALATVGEDLGTLHILVNNAGGARWLRAVEDLTPEAFLEGINLNLLAAHSTMRAAAPLLFQEPGRASVVNISSVAEASGLELMSYYSAAKFGLAGLTRAAAGEWGPRGVRVNCLGPGWTETELSSALRQDDDFFRKTLDRISLKRWATPEEVADGIVYLASDASRYVTGTTLFVDGGYLA